MSSRCNKTFLISLLSVLTILMMICATALAQDTSAALDAAETWNEADAVLIMFEGDTVDIQGSGAAVSNGILTIDKAGTYVFTGTWNNGRVSIAADKEDVVRLVFNGVSIHCPDNAPVYASQADMVVLTLIEGTKNELSDGSAYGELNGEEAPDAALYVQDSLTINGRGTLTVNAGSKHGIVSKDDLLIESGILFVTAADVGIRGRDTLEITGGEIHVTAKGDALQSNNADDPEKGRILLSGGTYTLSSEKDGIQAESVLTISGGTFTLYTGGAPAGSGEIKPEEWQHVDSSADAAGKGLKAGGDLNIRGGTFRLYCYDDALNAGGKIAIQDGTFDIATKDDGLHADGSVSIAGGRLALQTCYEGIDAASISVSGGTVQVNALDDGFNTSTDSSDSSASGESTPAPGDTSIRITGGEVALKTGGDGVDCEGSMTLEGGSLVICVPNGDKNSIADFGGSLMISGGTLAASGNAILAQALHPESIQATLIVRFEETVRAGCSIDLKADTGDTVLSCVPEQDFQTLLLSAPGLVQGKTYTLALDGNSLFTSMLDKVLTVVNKDGSPAEDGV